MVEILVNTSIVGDQQASAIAGFRGTQYVVVWQDSGDATIKGQMFAVNGNKTSSEFVVNLPGAPNTSAAAAIHKVLRNRMLMVFPLDLIWVDKLLASSLV